MKTMFKSIIIAATLAFMFSADIPLLLEQRAPNMALLFEQLVPEAEAIYGVRRRTRRRTAVVVGSAAAANTAAAEQQTAAAQQQAAAAEQEADAARQEADAAKQEAEAAKQQAAAATPPPPAATGKPLPLGTVVAALPGGCTATPVGGVEYYYCGGNFYRAVMQGNSLVYVTAKPE